MKEIRRPGWVTEYLPETDQEIAAHIRRIAIEQGIWTCDRHLTWERLKAAQERALDYGRQKKRG